MCQHGWQSGMLKRDTDLEWLSYNEVDIYSSSRHLPPAASPPAVAAAVLVCGADGEVGHCLLLEIWT
jgi:hypothetical protein